MSHNLEVPEGWTRGEQLTIERIGEIIVVRQTCHLTFDLDRAISPDDIANMHWHTEDWKQVTSFLAWWMV